MILKQEVGRAVSMFKEMPDLDKYGTEELEGFFVTAAIPKPVADEIRGSRNKTIEYDKYLERKQLNDAREAFTEFDEYYNANKIFLKKDIKGKFADISQKLWSVWASRKTSIVAPTASQDFWIKAFKQLKDEVEPLMDDIEELVQEHLYENQLI